MGGCECSEEVGSLKFEAGRRKATGGRKKEEESGEL